MEEGQQFELRIEPMGWRVRVSAEQPIMAGARSAGVWLPQPAIVRGSKNAASVLRRRVMAKRFMLC